METNEGKRQSGNVNMTNSSNPQQNLGGKEISNQQNEFEGIVQNLKVSEDPEIKAIGTAYSEYLDDEGISKDKLQFSCGGLQNFLQVKKKSTTSEKFDIPTSSPHALKISSLPDSLLFHIFSFLNTSSISTASRVNRRWKVLLNDDIFWKKKIERDIPTWRRICYKTNPDAYQGDSKDRDVYIDCCPELNKLRQTERYKSPMIQLFGNLMLGVPNIAIFGPGLDSGMGIDRQLISGDNGEFSFLGFTPSLFYGIGSGILLRVRGKKMNLMCLHGNSAKVRECEDREQNNKMIDVDINTQQYLLKPDFQHLCRKVSGFIFAVEGSIEASSAEKMALCRMELFAMVSELWVLSTIPVVIMSCVPQCSDKHRPAIEIVRGLRLDKLKRPWMIQNVTAENLCGAADAVSWVLRRY